MNLKAMSFSVFTLSNVIGASVGNQSSTLITIIENDVVPTAGIIQFSGSAYMVSENASTILLTITRTNGSYGSVNVDINTIDGSALAAEHYQQIVETLTFLDGEISQTVLITIIDNADFGGDKNFNVSLSNLQGDATLSNYATASITIVEDEPPPPAGILQLSGESYSVESGQENIVITVVRTEGSFGNVSVDYPVYENSESTLTSGAVYFVDGQISQTITLNVVDYNIDENTEFVTVTLSNTSNAVLGDIQSAKVLLQDEDLVDEPLADESPESGKGSSSSGSFTIEIFVLFMLIFYGLRYQYNRKIKRD